MNELVLRAALVIPWSTSFAVAGLASRTAILEELGIAWIRYLDLAHHLAYDDLEMLVVDLHTLQTVNRLDLVDDVVLGLDRSEDVEDVGRRGATVGQLGAGLDVVVLLDEDLLGERNEIVHLLSGFVLDDDFAVAPLDLAHKYLTVDFGEDGRG